jgi:uncharacterized membrane protein
MELREALVWLSGVGAVIATSWIFEYFQFSWFENLESKKKQMVFLIISIIVGVGAKLILKFVSPSTIDMLTEYFVVVFAIFSYLFLGDGFHKQTKIE